MSEDSENKSSGVSKTALVDEHNKEFHGTFRWNLPAIREKAGKTFTRLTYNKIQKAIGPNADAQRVFKYYRDNSQVRHGSKLHLNTHTTCK